MKFSEEIKSLIDKSTNQIERNMISDDDLVSLKSTFKNVPDDFLVYLKNVGAGDLVESSIKIYSTLCDFSDLGLEDVYEVDSNVIFFGDNYAGDFLGFDIENYKDEVIEFWHDSSSIHRTGKSFREFILENLQH